MDAFGRAWTFLKSSDELYRQREGKAPLFDVSRPHRSFGEEKYERMRNTPQREEDAFDEASQEAELSMSQPPFLTPSERQRAIENLKSSKRHMGHHDRREIDRRAGSRPERFSEYRVDVE